MSDTFVVSLISILGILISGIASFIVAKLQNKTALEKIKKELEQQYAKSLFDKRLEVYPKLFKLLSGFNKLIEYNIQTKEKLSELQHNLRELQHNLDEWNNEYAILLTTTSARIAYRYRFYLIDLFQNYSESKIPIPKKDWSNIRTWINIRTLNVAFEKSLRAEIGIYDIRAAGILDEEEEKVKTICGEATERIHNIFDQVENKKGAQVEAVNKSKDPKKET